MTPDILTSTEEELKKYLDLRGARISRTGKCLLIHCIGRRGGQQVERFFAMGPDGRWEITGCPVPKEKARILVQESPARGGSGLSIQDIRTIAKALRMDSTERKDK